MTGGDVVELGQGWGAFTLGPRGEPLPEGAAAWAYDSLGNRLTWRVDARTDRLHVACDVEWRGRSPDPLLLRQVPPGVDFWEFWVRAEVSAKLTDVPILVWLRRFRTGTIQPARERVRVVRAWMGQWTLAFAYVPRESGHRPMPAALHPEETS